MAAEYFGPYVLTDLLGRGGMGEVWRAHDTRKDREVALKVLGGWLASDPGYALRFRREAALAARLTAPHIIPIHDYGEIDGRLFIEMPLIDGTDLDARVLRDGPLSPARAVAIVEQVAEALDTAHDAGMLHRDVKPSNVLLAHRSRKTEFVYLIDFGIARSVDDTKITTTGRELGTLAYMAPERFSGDGDRRSDVYALACVLHVALAGRAPFVAPTGAHELGFYVNAHLNLPPPRASGHAPGVPRALDDVVVRGMAKQPGDRYDSAGALAAAARDALDSDVRGTADTHRVPPGAAPGRPALPTNTGSAGPTVVPPNPLAAPVARPDRRRRARNSIVAAVLVTLLAASWLVVENLPSGTEVPQNGPGPTTTSAAPAVGSRFGVGASVPVGRSPGQLAMTSDAQRLLVVNGSSYTVTIIDNFGNGDTHEVRVGNSPQDLAITPDATTALVTDYESASVSVVDIVGGKVTATIPVGGVPFNIAIAPDGRHAYVTNLGSSELEVLDIASRSVQTAVPLTAPPNDVTVAPDGKRAFVSSSQRNTITVIDTASNTVAGTIADPDGPARLAVSPDGRTLYATHTDTGSLGVVDLATATLVGRIPVGQTPYDIAFTPDGKRAYVPNLSSDTVSVVDVGNRSTIASIPLDGGPSGVVVAPDGGVAYVSTDDPGAVHVITGSDA